MTLRLSFDEYLPLRDIVFKTLREAIINGELKPGERLMEIKLAGEMGVSRTPVREAIRKLELEGLVIMTPRKGAEVASINEKDLREVLEIRRALEGLACVLASKKITDEQLGELKEINNELAQIISSSDVEKIAALDVKFHDAIYNATGNGRLIVGIHQMKEHIFRYRREYIKDLKNRESIVNDHNRIIEALEKRDGDAAGHETEKHIVEQEEFIIETIIK